MFHRFKPDRLRQSRASSAQRLHEKISAIQRSCANRLNHQARKLPVQNLKALFMLAGLAACGAAAGLIYQGISPENITVHRFELSLPRLWEPISVPASPARQQALDRYLDSLEKAFILDSIQNAKPTTSHELSPLQ